MTLTRFDAPPKGRLTATQGTALYVGAVLGTGVIALPGLAARAAGPASLLAWLVLVLLSVPLAATFAALGSRYPDSGGVATYARAAFGERAGQFVGCCFYFAIPVGAPAAALIAGGYVSSALGGGTGTAVVTGGLLIAAVFATNVAGIHVSARFQLVLGALLLAFLVVAVSLSLPHATTGNLRPFAPHGLLAVGSAGGLLIWSFAGWEAITSLAGDFRDPGRDLPRATGAAVAIVGVLYLAVATATITVLGPSGSRSAAPLGDLMARGLGGNARWLAAAVAVLLTFGVLNAYFAGAARLGAALGRDGALPVWLAPGGEVGAVPRRSLGAATAMSALSLLIVAAAGIGLSPLVSATSALLVAIYTVCVAAAVRLLPGGSRHRAAAIVAAAAVIVMLAMTGPYLAVPLALLVAITIVRRSRRSLRRSRDDGVEADSRAARKDPTPRTCAERATVASLRQGSGTVLGVLSVDVESVGAELDGRRVVVTGGAGFLGSHTCAALVECGAHVVCVDDESSGLFSSVERLALSGRFEAVRADVTAGIRVAGAVDVVLHLACPASPVDYQRRPVDTLRCGSEGTLAALRLAGGHGARFVLASTSEVYGDPQTSPQTESYWGHVNPIGPRSMYDEAKRFAEALTVAANAEWGVRAGIVRIFNTYGPGMRPDDGRVVATFIRQALTGQPLTIHGDGRQTRSLCHVTDTVRGLLAMAGTDHPGPINLGNPQELSVKDIAERVRLATGSAAPLHFEPAAPEDPRRRRPDIGRAARLLGWTPAVSLDEGLADSVAWYRDHLGASTTTEPTHPG
ncbi:MAG: amino acid permease [Nocardioidaceae bacterium]